MPLGFDEVFRNLRSMTVQNSQLSQITKIDFYQIKMLKQLIITHNSIRFIEADSFRANNQLEKIDLSHNKLTSLPERIFSNLPNLKSLILSNNDIKQLHMNVIDCPAPIRYFDFSGNGETISVQANIANICLKNADFIDFSKVFCIDIEDYKIHKGVNHRLHDEMFGVLDVNCKF
jgi:Leucine-rich repeat (LRR) protein